MGEEEEQVREGKCWVTRKEGERGRVRRDQGDWERRASGDVNKQHHGVGEKGRRGGGVWVRRSRKGSEGFGVLCVSSLCIDVY